MDYDILVLGGGPAGLSAAISARSRNRTVCLMTMPWEQNPLARAGRVDNYPGLYAFSGSEILQTFYRQAESMKVEILYGKVTSMTAFSGISAMINGKIYSSRALVLCPGVQQHEKVGGEVQFLGWGVSYCATCDGMLYRKRDVVVVGLSHDSPEEANYLLSIGCSVTYVAPAYPGKRLNPAITFVSASRYEIQGEGKHVTGLWTENGVIPCSAIFLLRDVITASDMLPALKMKDNFIEVGPQLQTNLPGVFAAGDCIGKPLQVAKAVGEGQVAALAACQWLEEQDRKQFI